MGNASNIVEDLHSAPSIALRHVRGASEARMAGLLFERLGRWEISGDIVMDKVHQLAWLQLCDY